MGIPLIQGCSDPLDEHGDRRTEIATKDGWRSVTMSVEGLGLRNPLTRSLTPEGENETAAERIRVLVFDKDNKFSYEAKVTSFIPSGDPMIRKARYHDPAGEKYLFGQYQYFRGAGQYCRVRRDWGGRVDRKNTGRGHGTFHILHARQRGMEGRGAPDVGNLGVRSRWITVPAPFQNSGPST